jgi:hypothetical protein
MMHLVYTNLFFSQMRIIVIKKNNLNVQESTAGISSMPTNWYRSSNTQVSSGLEMVYQARTQAVEPRAATSALDGIPWCTNGFDTSRVW